MLTPIKTSLFNGLEKIGDTARTLGERHAHGQGLVLVKDTKLPRQSQPIKVKIQA